MSNYNFQTNDFALSQSGIHLLRSEFNYRTIQFSEIRRIQISKGKEVHNWWLVFLLGAVLILLGVYLSIGAIKVLINGDIAARNSRLILLLFIPIVGGYFVYNSLQSGLILTIDCADGYKDMFPLKDIVRDNRLREFEAYLKREMDLLKPHSVLLDSRL